MGVGAAACEPGTLSIIRQLFPDKGTRARALGLVGRRRRSGPGHGAGHRRYPGGSRRLAGHLLVQPRRRRGDLRRLRRTSSPRAPTPRRPSPTSSATSSGPIALGTVVFAIILGETAGYTAPHVLALFAIGAAVGGLFVFVELRSTAPMLEVGLLPKAALLRLAAGGLRHLLRRVLHLLPHRALPTDRRGLHGLSAPRRSSYPWPSP